MPIPEYLGILPSTPMDTLIKRMKMTMKLYGGIGLSANQCGVFHRVFVIGTEDFQIACINPKVTASSTEMIKDNEGCLTFPGLCLKIERPKWIDVEFTDVDGQTQQARLDGLTARCFLHELDHLNGICFTQLAGAVSLSMARKKQEKIVKKAKRKNNGLFV
jgi:peptide deformylase